MLQILIIGWYGTETIGDRAILASLLMHFSQVNPQCSFTIGSIYPFYTERTILEDSSFYAEFCSLQPDILSDIKIVDSRNPCEYTKAIKSSDIVVIGGGPFDDMMSMYMLEYAFKKAKQYHKKTMIYGCGLNVIRKKEFIRTVKNIMHYADCIILRDQNSKRICKKINLPHPEKIKVSIDPAVFAAVSYKHKGDVTSVKHQEDSQNIVVNLRDFPPISAVKNISPKTINRNVMHYIYKLNKYNLPVKMVAMNYFAGGNDDRDVLNYYKYKYDDKAIVINQPLTLQQTFDIFIKATYCIGMRFHSVVFQTILNGNNYILNYTAPGLGKIPGFIEQIQGTAFYQNRFIELQTNDAQEEIHLQDSQFTYSIKEVERFETIYQKSIRNLMDD